MSDEPSSLDDFGGDVPPIAIAALSPIAMPDALYCCEVAGRERAAQLASLYGLGAEHF